MIEKDTVRLLRECDAGVKMGVKGIDDVIDYVHSHDLKELLNACKDEHDKLNVEIQKLLEKYNDKNIIVFKHRVEADEFLTRDLGDLI